MAKKQLMVPKTHIIRQQNRQTRKTITLYYTTTDVMGDNIFILLQLLRPVLSCLCLEKWLDTDLQRNIHHRGAFIYKKYT